MGAAHEKGARNHTDVYWGGPQDKGAVDSDRRVEVREPRPKPARLTQGGPRARGRLPVVELRVAENPLMSVVHGATGDCRYEEPNGSVFASTMWYTLMAVNTCAKTTSYVADPRMNDCMQPLSTPHTRMLATACV